MDLNTLLAGLLIIFSGGLVRFGAVMAALSCEMKPREGP